MYGLYNWAGRQAPAADLVAVGRDIEKLKAHAQTQEKVPVVWGNNFEGGACGDDGTEYPGWGYYIEEVEEIV